MVYQHQLDKISSERWSWTVKEKMSFLRLKIYTRAATPSVTCGSSIASAAASSFGSACSGNDGHCCADGRRWR